MGIQTRATSNARMALFCWGEQVIIVVAGSFPIKYSVPTGMPENCNVCVSSYVPDEISMYNTGSLAGREENASGVLNKSTTPTSWKIIKNIGLRITCCIYVYFKPYCSIKSLEHCKYLNEQFWTKQIETQNK